MNDRWVEDSCPTSGLVQRERTGELPCGDASAPGRDRPRRSDETCSWQAQKSDGEKLNRYPPIKGVPYSATRDGAEPGENTGAAIG